MICLSEKAIYFVYGVFSVNFFLWSAAGIDWTFLEEFTNDDEMIIFRVFAAKIAFSDKQTIQGPMMLIRNLKFLKFVKF